MLDIISEDLHVNASYSFAYFVVYRWLVTPWTANLSQAELKLTEHCAVSFVVIALGKRSDLSTCQGSI